MLVLQFAFLCSTQDQRPKHLKSSPESLNDCRASCFWTLREPLMAGPGRRAVPLPCRVGRDPEGAWPVRSIPPHANFCRRRGAPSDAHLGGGGETTKW